MKLFQSFEPMGTPGQDPAMWRDLESKLHTARRFHDEVRGAVLSRDWELGPPIARAVKFYHANGPYKPHTLIGRHPGVV